MIPYPHQPQNILIPIPWWKWARCFISILFYLFIYILSYTLVIPYPTLLEIPLPPQYSLDPIPAPHWKWSTALDPMHRTLHTIQGTRLPDPIDPLKNWRNPQNQTLFPIPAQYLPNSGCDPQTQTLHSHGIRDPVTAREGGSKSHMIELRVGLVWVTQTRDG